MRQFVRRFSDLTEQEILALAISLGEEHTRVFSDYADILKDSYPASTKVFIEMSEEENKHRRLLLDLYIQKFGDQIPSIRSHDIKGFSKYQPNQDVSLFNLEAIRKQAEVIKYETRVFYEKALEHSTDASIRKLLGDLALKERKYESLAVQLGEEYLTAEAKDDEEETRKRKFVLQVVQPGLAGLMDGSVSTLAPLFAAAFATQNTWETFLVGMAASVGAGISMGFAEALSDDGSLTGRGRPWLRGWITGIMTAVGGIGHTLPYLIPNFEVATALAIIIVLIELWAIAWIRARYMDTNFLKAAFEVVVGGFIVFGAGVGIGMLGVSH